MHGKKTPLQLLLRSIASNGGGTAMQVDAVLQDLARAKCEYQNHT
jgi:hypothetical protein